MVFRYVFVAALICAVSGSSAAQYFNSHKVFQSTRNEFAFGVGPSNYLGELGGANRVGRNFIQDLETSLSKFSFSMLHRRFINNWSAISYGFFIGGIEGNDELTNEVFRRNRNIHFKSSIVEITARYEYHFKNEKPGALYHLKGVKRHQKLSYGLYVFAGVSGFRFNPKALLNGRWVDLQPMGTEGQGLNGTDPYSLYQIAMPFGFGFRYKFSHLFRIGIEAGVRKTFTDYLDDTSTDYYDPDLILAARGADAAYFSNPTNASFEYDYQKKSGLPSNRRAAFFAKT